MAMQRDRASAPAGSGASPSNADGSIATKRYLGRKPAPFADFGSMAARWTWGVISAWGVCVAAGWAICTVVRWDALSGLVAGGVVGTFLGYVVMQNTEPYEKQVPDYLLDLATRKARYAPAPPRQLEGAGARARLRCALLGALGPLLLDPSPSWRLLAPGGVTRPMEARGDDGSGMLVRTDGGRVALARVGPVHSYDRREPAERAAVGRAFGEVTLALAPGQQAQFLIVNRARPVAEALAEFDRRQTAGAPPAPTGDAERDGARGEAHARRVAYLGARRAGLERRYKETHIPDVRCYAAVAESIPAGLEMARVRVGAAQARVRRARRLLGRMATRTRARRSELAHAQAALAVEEAAVSVAERDLEFGFQVDAILGKVRQAGCQVELLCSDEIVDAVARSTRGPMSFDAPLARGETAGVDPATGSATWPADVSALHRAACAVEVDARHPSYLILHPTLLDTDTDEGEGEGEGEKERRGAACYVGSLVCRGLPPTVDYGWVAPLTRLPFPSDVALYVEGRAKEREEDRIEGSGSQAADLNDKREARMGGGRRKGRLSRMERESDATLEDLDAPDVTVAGVALIVTVYASTRMELRRRTALARAALRGLHCRPGPGWGHQKALWLATRPLALGDAPAMLTELTPVVRTMFPFTSANPGSRGGMPLGLTTHRGGGGAEAVSLDFDDAETGTQQVGVGGLPHSGKGFFGNAALAWGYFEDGNISVVMDRSGTYAALCEELGETYITPLDPESVDATRLTINPYEMVLRAIPSPQQQVARLLAMHEAMYGRADERERMSNWQFQKLSAALSEVVRRDYSGLVGVDRVTPYPLERDTLRELEGIVIARGDTERRREKEDVIAGFSNYVGQGPWAELCDRESTADIAGDGRLYVFDTRHCSEGKNAIVAFWIIESFVEWCGLRLVRSKARRHDGKPAMVVELIDEGWSVMEVAAPHISQATLTSRHVNRRFIFILQFLSKLFDHPLGQDLASVVPWWVLGKLRNERAGHAAGTGWLARPLDIPLEEALELPHLGQEPNEWSDMMLIKRGMKRTDHGVVRVMAPSEEDVELWKTNPTEKEERAALTARYGSLHAAVFAAARARRAARRGGSGR